MTGGGLGGQGDALRSPADGPIGQELDAPVSGAG
jgi:hypothetical protein